MINEHAFAFVRKNKTPAVLPLCGYTLPHAKFEVPSLEPYEKQPWTEGQKTYAAMITRADGYIGRILQMLKESGLEKDTVVFVTSDNGAHFGDEKGFSLFTSNGPLRGQKGQPYEGGIRDPLIVRWPGKVKAGGVSGYPWAFWDFMPTAADIASVARLRRESTGCRPCRPSRARASRSGSSCTGNSTVSIKKPVNRGGRCPQTVRTGKWKGYRQRAGAPGVIRPVGGYRGDEKRGGAKPGGGATDGSLSPDCADGTPVAQHRRHG